jgi:pSer/pThr/pTyr-binding forkhead associated (FHA) protein
VPEALLTVLKLCCLALLYLFFLRVLRAVWAEVNLPRQLATAPAPAAPRPGQAPKSSRRRRNAPATHLVVVEPRVRKGQAYQLDRDEMTVGRAAGCQVALADDYASSLHARVFRREGGLFLEDLGSTNGTFLNDRKVTGAVPMQRGDRVKIGGTVLEVVG